MSTLGSNFYTKLIQVASEVQMKPEYILNVMFMESGLDPSAHNKNGDASGLAQLMPETLKGLGFKGTHKDFRDLEAEKQLDYVKKLIEFMMKINGGPFTSAAQYHIGSFIPAALRIPGVRKNEPSTIICSKNPTEPHIPGISIEKEASFYKNNSGVDSDKDGNITYADFANRLKAASQSKNFIKILADLKEANDKLPTDQQIKNDQTIKPKEDSMLQSFLDSRKSKTPDTLDKSQDEILIKYLNELTASDKNNIKKYYSSIPVQSFTIKIQANKTDAIEFSRILSEVLEEELGCKAFILSDNKNVELGCNIPGPLKESYAAIKELSQCVSESFSKATKKIGSIDVKTTVINSKSNISKITLEAAESNYRKFILKFIKG